MQSRRLWTTQDFRDCIAQRCLPNKYRPFSAHRDFFSGRRLLGYCVIQKVSNGIILLWGSSRRFLSCIYPRPTNVSMAFFAHHTLWVGYNGRHHRSGRAILARAVDVDWENISLYVVTWAGFRFKGRDQCDTSKDGWIFIQLRWPTIQLVHSVIKSSLIQRIKINCREIIMTLLITLLELTLLYQRLVK